MSNCGSRPKKMKYGGKVKKMAEGGAISSSDRKMLDKMIAEISEGTFVSPEARLKNLQKEKMPSGPIRMPKKIKEKRKAKAAKSKGRDTTGITRAMRDEIGQVKGYAGGGAVRGMGCAVSGGKYTGCK